MFEVKLFLLSYFTVVVVVFCYHESFAYVHSCILLIHTALIDITVRQMKAKCTVGQFSCILHIKHMYTIFNTCIINYELFVCVAFCACII